MDKNSFSAREGGQDIEFALVGAINERVRMCIWNLVHDRLLPTKDLRPVEIALRRYIHWPVDDASYNDYESRQQIRAFYLDSGRAWHFPYDLFEYHAFSMYMSSFSGQNFSSGQIESRENQRSQFAGQLNAELARAGCAYLFVAGLLTPITSSLEADEVRRASSAPAKFHGTREHICAGLDSLAKKPTPEVRNCIEESLHAVESALKVATGVTTGGVKDALDKFATQHAVHGALRDAIKKLYGYASNKPGLRHPLLDEKNDLTPVDARMMLVTASSIVNWIISKDSGLDS